MEYGFVVLHYKEIKATCECVKSIKALSLADGDCLRIVVVDNGSANNTGETLRNLYSDDGTVDVVISEENLGFACGNNLGLSFYTETYGLPDYLSVCNNDTVVDDVNFLSKVHSIHEKFGFNVLGPDIYNPLSHEHQSPCGEGIMEPSEIDRMISDCRANLRMYRSPTSFDRIWISIKDSSLYRACANAKHKIKLFEKKRGWENTQRGVVLQGSFLVFDRCYLNSMPWLFSPKTFMYFEENFLQLCSIKSGLKLLYTPEVQVLHLHGLSTSVDRPRWSQRQLFYYENILNSLIEYRNLLES